jgi:hypothetical protein
LRTTTRASSAKAPLDFFSYHVISVDEDSQLLLVDVHVLGASFATMACYRSRVDETWVTHAGVRFQRVSCRIEW